LPGIHPTRLLRGRSTPHRFALALLALGVASPLLAEEIADEVIAPAPMALEWHADIPHAAAEAPVEAGHDDVWQRIRAGFRIDDAASPNPLVSDHAAWFAARPENVRRLAVRARPYLYHIVEELDRRAMPMEIALLPMIESAFNPVALSPSAASGIWQFIPSTGRHYGLRQDSWYDGRRDFTAATGAALDYLGKLYLDFGDWQLALAAYNCGEGCIARAIQSNVQQGLPTDYASLSLPSETRHYVPRLLALRNLIHAPALHGIAIEQLPNQPYFSQITVHASMDLHSAARLANMSSDEFAALNAAFPRKLIRSDTPVNLLVPVDRSDTFQRNLEAGHWDSWQPYAAQRGEQAAAIARRFDVSLARLEEHNQMQLNKGRLVRAQTILVPVRNRGATTQQTRPARHVVQPGDTLFGIARSHGLTLAQLAELNPGLDAALRPGQVLHLPGSAGARVPEGLQAASLKASPARPDPAVRHTVRRGDTLLDLAQRYDVGLTELKTWNPAIGKRGLIRAGQRLVVSAP
jgi:membrane-bound lytic murein transglycosylase D